ncbi:MAG: phospholipid-binding protein MlaC [Succinivibrionaceae bacterium]
MFKKLLTATFGFLLLVGSGITIAAESAYDTINNVANQLFPKLSEEKASINNNEAKLKEIVKDYLMPYVDLKYAAYKVMGANIRNTNEDQRARFVNAFEIYIIDTYSSALGKYNNQTITIDPKTTGDAKSTIVNVKIKADEQVYDVAFKLRQNTKTGQWKVYDLVAEGISLLSSKQAEFNELISKNGIDKVCDMLEKHQIKSKDAPK